MRPLDEFIFARDPLKKTLLPISTGCVFVLEKDLHRSDEFALVLLNDGRVVQVFDEDIMGEYVFML